MINKLLQCTNSCAPLVIIYNVALTSLTLFMLQTSIWICTAFFGLGFACYKYKHPQINSGLSEDPSVLHCPCVTYVRC